MKKTSVRSGPSMADKAAQRDRVSSTIIDEEHAKMVKKTERLRALRKTRDAEDTATALAGNSRAPKR